MKLLYLVLSIVSMSLCINIYAAEELPINQYSVSLIVARGDKKTRFVNYNLVTMNNQPREGQFVMFGHDNGANIVTIGKKIKAEDLLAVHNILLSREKLKDDKSAMEELSTLGYPTWQDLQWQALFIVTKL